VTLLSKWEYTLIFRKHQNIPQFFFTI
jgi:hypothetical protein